MAPPSVYPLAYERTPLLPSLPSKLLKYCHITGRLCRSGENQIQIPAQLRNPLSDTDPDSTVTIIK